MATGRTNSVGKFRNATDTRHPARTQPSDAAIADAFEQELAEAIMELIAQSCRIKGTEAVVLRVAESVSALVSCLASVLALSPAATRSPTRTRRIINDLHKRLRTRLSRMQPEADAFRARAFKDGNVRGRA